MQWHPVPTARQFGNLLRIIYRWINAWIIVKATVQCTPLLEDCYCYCRRFISVAMYCSAANVAECVKKDSYWKLCDKFHLKRKFLYWLAFCQGCFDSSENKQSKCQISMVENCNYVCQKKFFFQLLRLDVCFYAFHIMTPKQHLIH